jgi:hypothetical protein
MESYWLRLEAHAGRPRLFFVPDLSLPSGLAASCELDLKPSVAGKSGRLPVASDGGLRNAFSSGEQMARRKKKALKKAPAPL